MPRCTVTEGWVGRKLGRAGGGHRRPGGVPDPVRRGQLPTRGHRPAGRRPAARAAVHRRRSPTPSTTSLAGSAAGGGRSLMRVAIAGAGAVGRSIAGELLDNGHEVMLIDKEPPQGRAPSAVPGAPSGCSPTPARSPRWRRPALQPATSSIAATGDDKVNLVVSLLAKTEFAVAARRRPGQRPEQRVALQRGLGRRRRRLHAARAGGPGRGGGDRRRPGPADDASARARPTWSRSRCPRTRPWSATRSRDVPLPAGHGAGHDPARRAGHHPAPGRAAGGRRRAAVRRRRGRGGHSRAVVLGCRPVENTGKSAAEVPTAIAPGGCRRGARGLCRPP